MASPSKRSWFSKLKRPGPNGPDSQDVATKNLASLFVIGLSKAHSDLKAVLDVLLALEAAKLAKDKPLERVVQYISDLTLVAEKQDSGSQLSAVAAMRQAHISLSGLAARKRELVESEVDAMILIGETVCPGLRGLAKDSKVAHRRSVLMAWLGTASTTLEIVNGASEGIPFMKPIIRSLAGLLGAVHTMELNRDGVRDLLNAIGSNILAIAQQCSDPRVKSKTLEKIMGELQIDVRPIVEDCNKLKKKWALRRMLENKNDENALAGLNRAFESAVDRFTRSVALQMYGALNDVDAKTDLLLLGQHLPNHPPIPRRLNEYYPGSRDEALRLVRGWLDDPNGELMLWIQGAAGIGKSTLAQRLCEDLRKANQLAAEVVLGVLLGADNEKTPAELIQVISSEIGNTRLSARWKIADAIRSEGGLSIELSRLLEQCILEPLRTVSTEDANVPSPLVIVIDALDEWPAHPQFIAALEHLNPHSATVRFVVLGRHAPPSAPHDAAMVNISPYFLGGVAPEVIEGYLTERLQKVQVPADGTALGQSEAQVLAWKADGLFIWASVALSLIAYEYSSKSPRQTYEDIVASNEAVGTSETRLHVLYRKGMDLLFPNPKQQDLVCRYVRLILVLQEPIPLADGARLLHVPTAMGLEDIRTKLTAFYIRQQLDSGDIQPAGTLFHLSFNEYLTKEKSGGEYTAHEMVAGACLQELAKRPCATVPVYAIKYWPLHAAFGSPLVTPASDDDWKASLVHGAFCAVPLEALREWAMRFSKIVTANDWHGQAESPEQVMTDLACGLDYEDSRTRGYAISCLEIAARLRPRHHKIWSRLGCALWDQHEYSGAPEVLDRAVVAHQCAMDAGVEDADAQRDLLFALASTLGKQAEQLGNPEGIYQPIAMLRQVLALTPPGHPDRSGSLNNLAMMMGVQFDINGAFNDLTEAIALYQEALELVSSGHPDRSGLLNNLANALISRFNIQRHGTDLTAAIALHWQALELRQLGHPDRGDSLRNLAIHLYSRFDLQGDLNDLKEVSALLQQALDICPPGHQDRGNLLNNLALALTWQCNVEKESNNLPEAVSLARQALSLQPRGHPDRSNSLDTLAFALHSSFKLQYGSPNNLTEAISLSQEALELLPPGESEYCSQVSDTLASSLHSQFKLQGDHCKLTEAVSLHRQALERSQVQGQGRLLDNLADALVSQFEHGGNRDNLTEAIALYQQALDLRPPGHCLRDDVLRKRDNALKAQAELTGNPGPQQ